MPAIHFRGAEVEIATDIGTLSLDDAEIIESELGLDLRDLARLPKVKMFKALALISVRRVFSDATMAEVGRLPLMELAAAFGGSAASAAAAPVVEGVSVEPVEQPDGGEVLSPTSAASDSSSAPAV